MIEGDWYTWMDKYESKSGLKNAYLVDCAGGRIRLYRARDSDYVGAFTALQAQRFFYGLYKCYGKVPKNVSNLEHNIEIFKLNLTQAGISYEVKDANMNLSEEYSYLLATETDSYDYNERF